MRQLPTINLEGTDFTIDIRLGELRNSQPPYNSIPISSMDVSEDGYTLRFLYDRHAKGVRLEPIDPRNMPKHIVCLEIPYEVKLDPIGLAIKYNMEPKDFIKKFPVQQNLCARRIDLQNELQLTSRSRNLKQRIINAITPRKRLK